MPKPKLFIGASRENQLTATALQQELDYDLDSEIWYQGTFRASEFPLESLEAMLDRADFAVFIVAADDVTIMRGEERSTMRDNVLFELGLFIGKLGRKRVFFIAPRDAKLDLPSDLKGLTPLEYDAEKENRCAALGPPATEIRMLTKREGPLPRQSSELAARDETEKDEQEGNKWDPQPDATWSLERFAGAYFVSLMLDEDDAAQRLDDIFRAGGRSSEELAVWQSEVDLAHLNNGEHRPISAFRQRCSEYPDNPELALSLASALEHYGDTENAVEQLKFIAERGWEPDISASAIDRLNGLRPITLGELPAFRSQLVNSVGKQSTGSLATLSHLAASVGLPQIAAAIDELRLSREPDQTELRFDLAYRYSQDRQDLLSLYHYRAIPSGERSGTTWNNIGVAFGRLGMPGHAVTAFQTASEQGGRFTLKDLWVFLKPLLLGVCEGSKALLGLAVIGG